MLGVPVASDRQPPKALGRKQPLLSLPSQAWESLRMRARVCSFSQDLITPALSHIMLCTSGVLVNKPGTALVLGQLIPGQ